MTDTRKLVALDHRHVWHPFTQMAQWCQEDPLIIDRAQGPYLIDTEGHLYIDGVSSLWCNVHGHRVPQIDQAIRDQLDHVAHTTLLGLASPPSIELAARLCRVAPRRRGASGGGGSPGLTRVFYSDSGATAVEVALKMAVGYWFHRGKPEKNRFVAFGGAYHGDTAGSMSVGYNQLFHGPFGAMIFPVHFVTAPDACHRQASVPVAAPEDLVVGPRGETEGVWPSEDNQLVGLLSERSLAQLDDYLARHEAQTAAVILEPVMQGAAGMICQPPGFVLGVAQLTAKHDVLLIADEVATGFGRTGAMFACEHDGVQPDLMCVAKGISGGYLPLAATLSTDAVEEAFRGGLADRGRTFYHGHTYTGNALACAAALASLDLFKSTGLIEHINHSAGIIAKRLDVLRDRHDFPHVIDIRQRGVMVGIELGQDRRTRVPFEARAQTGARLCLSMRKKGLVIRPLGDVLVLMPIPAMDHQVLNRMLDIVTDSLRQWKSD